MLRETNVRPNAYSLNPMNDPGSEIEISVVVPIYREAESVEPLCQRLIPVLEQVATSFEVLFVDDGSTDETLLAIRSQNARDPRVKAVSFSRNFGKEIAI